jgi:very-short-patch-repair endonuclease
MPHSNISETARGRAQRLRRNQTEAERALWRLLQPFRQAGIRFRRQTPVGMYVADFAWLSGRLVIEVDGGQHNESTSDQRRDAWLKQQGFRVIRFWNNDVLQNPSGCAEVIASEIHNCENDSSDKKAAR